MGSTSASYPSPFVHACLSDWTTQTPLMCIKASLAPRSAVTSFCSREAEGTLCPLSADLSHQTCFDDFCTIYDLVSNKCLITNTFKTPFILHKDIIHLFPPQFASTHNWHYLHLLDAPSGNDCVGRSDCSIHYHCPFSF